MRYASPEYTNLCRYRAFKLLRYVHDSRDFITDVKFHKCFKLIERLLKHDNRYNVYITINSLSFERAIVIDYKPIKQK